MRNGIKNADVLINILRDVLLFLGLHNWNKVIKLIYEVFISKIAYVYLFIAFTNVIVCKYVNYLLNNSTRIMHYLFNSLNSESVSMVIKYHNDMALKYKVSHDYGFEETDIITKTIFYIIPKFHSSFIKIYIK